MNFVIIKSGFKESLAVVEKGTGDSQNLPILKNVLVEAENNSCSLTTTNLEIAVRYTVPCKVIEPGKLTVPLQPLHTLVGTPENERISVETKQNVFRLVSDNYEAKLQGMPADDFPIIPKIKNAAESIEIKSDILKDAIRKVMIATQFSDLRPELNSVLFDFSIDVIKCVATDGFRLAEKSIGSGQFSTTIKEPFRILVPLRTVQELIRILKDGETVHIFRDENQILFKTEMLEFISRLVDGNFPDYSAIIPKKFDSEVIIAKTEFVQALRLMSVFGNKNNEVKLTAKDNKGIEVAAAAESLGENKYVLSAKIKGTPEPIIFNWRYLLDVLKIIDTETVFFGLNDDQKASLLKSPGEGSYFYILKPILKA